jgi:hypothetical protein
MEAFLNKTSEAKVIVIEMKHQKKNTRWQALQVFEEMRVQIQEKKAM